MIHRLAHNTVSFETPLLEPVLAAVQKAADLGIVRDVKPQFVPVNRMMNEFRPSIQLTIVAPGTLCEMKFTFLLSELECPTLELLQEFLEGIRLEAERHAEVEAAL